MNPKISLSIQRFELSPDVRQKIQSIVEPLLSGERCASRVDLIIEAEYAGNTHIAYNTTLRAQLRGELLSELNQGEKIIPTVHAVVASMRRQLENARGLARTPERRQTA